MRNAISALEKAHLPELQNDTYIQERFELQIGHANMMAFAENQEEILSLLRMKLSNDVYAWGSRAGEVRSIIEEFIREQSARKYRENAKACVCTMKDDELRKCVIKLLDQYPEHCKFFLV